MSTSSFDNQFISADKESINRFLESLANPREVDIPNKDLKAENEKGLKILKRKFQRGF